MNEYVGQPASPGVAAGPLTAIPGSVAGGHTPRLSGRAAEDALAAALAEHTAHLAQLAQRATRDGRQILDFQIEMLSDEALLAGARSAIAAGADVADAWQRCLDAEIAGYEGADGDYFRARASDLRDMRDGVARRLAGGATFAATPGAILYGADLPPSLFLAHDWNAGGAVILAAGSTSSHVAMLARAYDVPMVVGLGQLSVAGHAVAMVNGDSGSVVLSPPQALFDQASEQALYRRGARELPDNEAVMTADGVQISVMINVASQADIAALDPQACDGIGLVRTEFLFDGRSLRDEETQYVAYRRLSAWAGARPVIVRAFDIGGDKPFAGLTTEPEGNPFLGTRGIRLLLRHPDVFATQLRALARAAAHADIRVMLPMVTAPDEIDAARRLLSTAVDGLTAAGIDCRRPPLGIMVEVPAVAVAPERVQAADFFSIGSNDLLQYVAAAARDVRGSEALQEAALPAVLRLMGGVVETGRQLQKAVSICGDLAAQERHLPALLAAGLRSFSVPPARLGAVKRALRTMKAST